MSVTVWRLLGSNAESARCVDLSRGSFKIVSTSTTDIMIQNGIREGKKVMLPTLEVQILESSGRTSTVHVLLDDYPLLREYEADVRR